MSTKLTNPFLSRINNILRHDRPLTPESLNYSTWFGPGEEHLYASLWFRTRGCRYDHRGECTMCDYWVSRDVSAEQMINAVRQALTSFIIVPEILLVQPSGSMFDEWEVPAMARIEIFRQVSEFPCKQVLCESRPETVQHPVIAEYAEILSTKRLGIELGLESATPWILRYCINKTLSLNEFSRAVKVARHHQVSTYANVLVGTAFLTPKEAIDDAVKSIQWAFAQGIDHCIVFPVHVKPWTLIHWLWERQLYSAPSLWSLVEVLQRLGPAISSQVYISWYRPQYRESHVEHGKRSDQYPDTCNQCCERVLALLDHYRLHNDYSIIDELGRMDCTCKKRWRVAMDTLPVQPLPDRVADYYDLLGRDILGSSRWEPERDRILESLYQAWDSSQETTMT